MHRKPENREQGDDGHQQTSRAFFPSTSRCRSGGGGSADGEAGHPVALDVKQDPDGEDSDDRQRKYVSEDEERGEDYSGDLCATMVATRRPLLVLLGLVGVEDGGVEGQHHRPDADHSQDDVPTGAKSQGGGAVDDSHVADGGYEHKGVDGHVGRDVDEVVHQFARDVAEGPARSGKVIGGRWRDDEDEGQVGQGQVQQEDVRDCSHRLVRKDDVDDETVAEGTDKGDGSEEDWNDEVVEDDVEVGLLRGR